MAITLQNWIDADKRNYRIRKAAIRAALDDLKTGMLDAVSEKNREDIFYMLCFCLCVPQSKQVLAEEAIEILREKQFYENGIPEEDLTLILRGKPGIPRVRFHNEKTKRLLRARERFNDFWPKLIKRYTTFDSLLENRDKYLTDVRDWLVKEIDGVGLKLSSHFLRNIGMRGLAILDVHVLRAMHRRGLIAEEKPVLTKVTYSDIEKEVQLYAKKIEIELDELDQLFWSMATGYVGK